MAAEKITSLQNPRIKQLVKLRDRRPRDEAGVFLVEGYRQIRRALEKGVGLTELYISPEWYLGENEPALIAQAEAAGAKVFELTKDAFAKVAYRERPDGLLAVAPQWKRTLDDLSLPVAGVADRYRQAPVSARRGGDREAGQSRHHPAERRCGRGGRADRV
jgi:RNA methyltransferase, TrmH family